MEYQSKLKRDDIDQLFDAVLTLEDREDCYRFFEDICTINEIHAIAQRLQVARLLSEKKTYSEIESITNASTATINLTTEKMTMTDADMQSCHNVGNIFKIILTTNPNAEPAPEPYAIKVVIDGKDTSVNAWDLSDKIQDNDGEKTIPLIEIVKAALGDDADVSQYTCDYANADESFVSSSKSACAEIQSCTFADMLTLSLTNEKLFYEDSSVPSCYSVKGFGTIYVTSVKD